MLPLLTLVLALSAPAALADQRAPRTDPPATGEADIQKPVKVLTLDEKRKLADCIRLGKGTESECLTRVKAGTS